MKESFKEPLTQNSQENSQERQVEKKEVERIALRIKDLKPAFPDWELNDEVVEKATKTFLKKEEIEIVSWKEIGVDIINGVRWWGVEISFSEK